MHSVLYLKQPLLVFYLCDTHNIYLTVVPNQTPIRSCYFFLKCPPVGKAVWLILCNVERILNLYKRNFD